MSCDDKELVKSYAVQGSDAAFRALVARHVDLVYASALRQVGDRGIAEEITQNVFVALARKAPSLAGRETLAGWLYRTTLLESKARIRAELRRRQREKRAQELACVEREGVSPLEEMAPLLDEGLLNLRETDRMALVLRFLENRPLREVGLTLGVDEDAARKRVSRALERLSSFFRQRGFNLPSAAASATLLTNASQAAPAALAVTASNAGLAAGGTTTGLNLFLVHVMTLTKTQTALVCLILATIPLAWQHHAQARVAARRAELESELAVKRQTAETLQSEAERNQAALVQAEADLQKADARLNQLTLQLEGKAPRPKYRWDDNGSLVRFSKAAIEKLDLNAVANHRGQLSKQIKEVLQMSGAEEQAAQEALNRFVAGFNDAQARTLREVSPKGRELEGHDPKDTRVLEISALGDQLGELRRDLFAQLESTLGAQRFQLFRKALREWMPLDDEYAGMNSGMAVFNFDHHVVFYKPEPGSQQLQWQIRKSNGEMMSFAVAADDVPPVMRPHVQDWIAIAQSQAPAESVLPK